MVVGASESALRPGAADGLEVPVVPVTDVDGLTASPATRGRIRKRANHSTIVMRKPKRGCACARLAFMGQTEGRRGSRVPFLFAPAVPSLPELTQATMR